MDNSDLREASIELKFQLLLFYTRGNNIMLLISAYPCLGKTTISSMNNKSKVFDRDFTETRSRLGMSEEQVKKFNNACCDIIQLQYETNYHDVLFITDDEEILTNLENRGIKPILVFPNGFDGEYLKEYKKKVIARSGEAWWDRVMPSCMNNLRGRIEEYKAKGYDIRLTDSKHPYIEDVIVFPKDINIVHNIPTNADRIRSMTDEELSKIMLCPYDAAGKPIEIMPCVKDGNVQEFVSPENCKKCMMKWLQSEDL